VAAAGAEVSVGATSAHGLGASAALEAYFAGGEGLDDHLGVVVHVGVRGVHQLEVPLAQHDGEDGLDLEEGKGVAGALVAPAAEGLVGVEVLVFGALGAVARGVEAVRLGEERRDAVRDGRAGPHHLALLDDVGADLEVLADLAHEHDQRRVQPQHLLQHGLEHRDLAQRVEGHLAIVAIDVVELVAHLLQQRRLLEQLQQHPGCGARAGVVAREEGADQHARDLVVVELAAVLVGGLHQALEHVARLLGLLPALRDDLAHQGLEAHARLVAPPEHGDREVRVVVGQRVHALLEVVIDLRELLADLVAELAPQQAVRGRPDGELLHEVHQLEHALFAAPLLGHTAHLGHDLAGVVAHRVEAQRRHEHAQLLVLALDRRVEDQPLTEDGRHQPIRRALVQLLVRRAVEGLTRHLAGQQHDLLAEHGELHHLAALVVGALHEVVGVLGERDHVPEEGQATAQARRALAALHLAAGRSAGARRRAGGGAREGARLGHLQLGHGASGRRA
jgi:hypothetical protein